MWYSASIFRHSTKIYRHGYLLPWRFYALCKMSETLERRKEGRTDRERVWCDWYCTRCERYTWQEHMNDSCHSLLPQAYGWEPSCTDKKVDGVTYLAVASSHFYIIFTCYSPNENRSCDSAITWFFSTLTKVFSTRAQMAFYQSPNSALHTALPWAKTCAAWKDSFQKGARALDCSSSLECQYVFWMLHNREFLGRFTFFVKN